MLNKIKNIILLGKVSIFFGKLLKYVCFIVLVVDILFFGIYYRINIVM